MTGQHRQGDNLPLIRRATLEDQPTIRRMVLEGLTDTPANIVPTTFLHGPLKPSGLGAKVVAHSPGPRCDHRDPKRDHNPRGRGVAGPAPSF